MKKEDPIVPEPEETPATTQDERYYVIKELHLHNCQGVVILQQGQPPASDPPKGKG